MHLTLDVALNLLWLSLSAAAFVWLGWRPYGSTCPRHGRLRRLLVVLLAAFAIFPAVSASDDLLSFALTGNAGGRGGWGNAPLEDTQEKASVHLVRILSSLEHGLQAHQSGPLPLVYCAGAPSTPRAQVVSRPVAVVTGRAPPTV